jgi:hypothetical protein
MTPNPAAEAAVARWLAGGATSLTHPVLNRVLADCYHPLGIEALWLEAEPFSALEAGGGEGWLRGALWSSARMDPAHPAARDLAPWISRAAEISATADGLIRLPPAGPGDPDPWLAIRHSVFARSRASAFLCAAAGSLLFDAEAAVIYRDGNDAAFVEIIWARLGLAKTDRNTAASAKASTKDATPEPPVDRPPHQGGARRRLAAAD